MLRCAFAAAPRSVALDPGVRLDDVLAIAQPFALAPLVASRLSRQGLSDADARRLDGMVAECAARSAILLHDAAAVSETLAAAGIPCVLLKGAALLAWGIVREPGDRHTDDVDVLVPEDDAQRAGEVLLAAGYGRAGSMDRVCYDGSRREDLRPPGEHSLMTLVSPLGTEIDLHYAVPDSRLSSFEQVAPGCDRVEASGTSVLVPAPALLLAHLCEHVTWHHALVPRYVPRHLADVATIADACGEDVWSDAEALADVASVRLSRTVLAAARRSPAVGRALLPGPADSHARELAIEVVRMARRVSSDAIHDPGRLARKIVPARRFIANTYGVDEDDPRLPLYYAHRLLTLRWLLRPYRG